MGNNTAIVAVVQDYVKRLEIQWKGTNDADWGIGLLPGKEAR